MTNASYSFVTLRTEDWSQRSFTDRGGQKYRVEGYPCPTEKCGAICCVNIPLIGPIDERCPHLQDDLRCSFHAQGGMGCKPVSCVVWPRTQADVDLVNDRFAEGDKRCVLQVVEDG